MLERLRILLGRRAVPIIDGVFLAVLTIAALIFCYEVQVFPSVGDAGKAHAIELNEALLVGTMFCAGMFLFALRRLAEQRRETARRIEAEQAIRTLAFHDALTGLPNRRRFDDALAAAVESLPRSGASHGVLVLDLNGFKRVNDVFGHAVGDELLTAVGGCLGECVREGDIVSRLGGDEFGILALNIGGAEAALGLALRIIGSLALPVSAGGSQHAIGAAIGIALVPQDGTDPAELLRKADIALYRAKNEGRSALRFYEAEMGAAVEERAALERELREAIAYGAIQPFYQPLIDLKSGRIRGFEVLARWTGDRLVTIGPERFIPIVEDMGLIGRLTDALLERACEDASAWPVEMEISLNVSPLLLRDALFTSRVLSILERTRTDPTRLQLEITESALVRDIGLMEKAFGGLRKVGVRIALDNFGTGYSTLYHLRNFKVDCLKIDRRFIESMARDGESAAIVRALVGLGEGLGMEVNAEGVETVDQQRLLIDHGCRAAQGFLFSEAVSAADIGSLLNTTNSVK